ncbi:unnamed protein product [Cunninghamella echinulata]
MFVSTSHGKITYDSEHDSQTSSSSSLQSWVGWFCSLSGHEYYVEVPEEFMDDDFNLTGLSSIVPYYNEALEMILDIEDDENQNYPSEDDDNIFDDDNNNNFGDSTQHNRDLEQQQQEEEEEEEEENNNNINNINQQLQQQNDDGFWDEGQSIKRRGQLDVNMIEPYAIMLYGLIHQRYLLSRNGLRIMAERYASGAFGLCPRVYCGRCPVIPCGRYDEVGKESVKLYCPSCLDLYNPPNSIYHRVDGAHFGTTYAHLMFENFSELIPLARGHIYQPKIFGFRVNERSRAGPRMQWLRMRPPEYIMNDDEYDEDDLENEEIYEEEEEDTQPISHIG